MQLLDDHVFEHYCEGLVTKEDAWPSATSPEELAARMAAFDKSVANPLDDEEQLNP